MMIINAFAIVCLSTQSSEESGSESETEKPKDTEKKQKQKAKVYELVILFFVEIRSF